VPGGNRRQLEQRAVAARVAIAEVGGRLVPRDVEEARLDALVEPRASEDELAKPVDERLAVHEGDVLPVADEVAAEAAPRLVDAAVGRELDEVGGLVVVQLVVGKEAEPHRRRDDALLEVDRVEAEPVSEELDDVFVAGAVVGLAHGRQDNRVAGSAGRAAGGGRGRRPSG
jgi:hypothetical protein